MDLEKKDEQPLRSPSVSTPATADPSRKRKRRRCIIICSSITGVILIIILVFLILGLTVLKPKKPVITVESASLEDLDVSANPIPPRISLNISLALVISIDNPNKVSIKTRNSYSAIRYRGREIGNIPIPAGKIGSDDKTRMNLTLTVFADRLVSDSEIYRDVIGRGKLPLSTYTRIKAKVRVLFINIHVTSTSTCDMNIDIRNSSIGNSSCHVKMKL